MEATLEALMVQVALLEVTMGMDRDILGYQGKAPSSLRNYSRWASWEWVQAQCTLTRASALLPTAFRCSQDWWECLQGMVALKCTARGPPR